MIELRILKQKDEKKRFLFENLWKQDRVYFEG